MKRDIVIPPFLRPDGTAIGGALVRFDLLGPDGRALIAQLAADGTPVTGAVDVRVHDDPVTIALDPTTDLFPGTVYRVSVRAGRVTEVYDCTFDYSANPLGWDELIGSSAPLPGAGVDAWLLHLADDERHLVPGDRDAIESASRLVDAVAGETLSGQRVVRIENAQALYASSAVQAHAGHVAGITTGAALADDPVSVQTTGIMTEPSWSWAPGPVYLGVGGALTQTPPETGFVLIVGRAIDATKMLIGIQTPILRS